MHSKAENVLTLLLRVPEQSTGLYTQCRLSLLLIGGVPVAPGELLWRKGMPGEFAFYGELRARLESI